MNEINIDDVISEYKKLDFTVNQDWPSNMLWEGG